jgi:hypothetical protein
VVNPSALRLPWWNDANSQHFLWIALHWAAAALHQTARTYAGFDPYFESRNIVPMQEVVSRMDVCIGLQGPSRGPTA